MRCPRCNEPSPFWDYTHNCCKDCVAADDLDRFIERSSKSTPKSTYKVWNFKTNEWEPLNGNQNSK